MRLCALIVALWSGSAAAGTIVVVKSKSIPPYDAAERGIKSAITGRVLVLDLAELGPARTVEQAQTAHPDAVVAIGPEALTLALEGLADARIVFCSVLQPHLRLGGKKIPGASFDIDAASQLQAFRDFDARIQKVGVIYDPATSTPAVEEARAAAKRLGMVLEAWAAPDLGSAISSIDKLEPSVDAFLMLPDRVSAAPEVFKRMLLSSVTRKAPLQAFAKKFVSGGALFCVEIDYEDVGAQAGEILVQLLAGKRGADLPITRVRSRQLVVNKNTMERLGLSLTDALKGRAVVE